MKINKIYIGAFGGLKDYTLELSEGLNVIFGENENGKTTVMSFLKMMFYGGKSGKNLAKSPRQKYTPWDSSAMGGRVYFEHAGHNYCLEREFKRSDSTDRVILRDTDLGTSESVASDIGKRFFSLSEAAFEKSVFIGNIGISETDDTASGELNAKLSNIAITGNESTSYRLVAKRIEDAMGELITKRRVGIYDKGLLELEQLKKDYAEADAAAHRRDMLSAEVKELKQQLSSTKKECLELKAVLDGEADHKNAEKLREYLEAKRQLDEINSGLKLSDGTQIDNVFIGKVNFCIAKYDGESTRLLDKQNDIDTLKKKIEETKVAKSSATPERLEEFKTNLDALSNQKTLLTCECAKAEQKVASLENELGEIGTLKKSPNFALLIIGIILAALGAFGIIKAIPYTFFAVILGVISIVLAFIFKTVNKHAVSAMHLKLVDAQNELASLRSRDLSLQGEINSLTSQISILTAALNTDRALLEQKERELIEKQEEFNKISASKQTALEELLGLFARYKAVTDIDEIKSQLDALNERTAKQKDTKLLLKYLSNDLGNISYEEAENKLKAISDAPLDTDIDYTALKEKLDALQENGVEVSNRLSATLTELNSELKTAVSPDTIEMQIKELEKALSSWKDYYDSANMALEVLEDSFAEVRRGFGSGLEERTLEIFSSLTGGRYDAVNISSNLEIEAESKGEFSSRSIEYLSSGTVDQAYLSLRLAVLELMNKEDNLPVLLDDSLSQYDDRRTEEALRFLKDYAKDTQVVLFTCHGAIRDTAKELEIKTKNLK